MLSKQATNFKNICVGGDINTIQQLLRRQSQSIKDELMTHFKADSYEELAIKMSQG